MVSDKSNLVSEIRQLLTTKKVLPELLVDVAAEYAEACATVNERLATVGKLLADGFRDEAIDLAEQRPKLLSHLQLVDFPERAQWNALLAKANVGTPTELLSNEAEQLEQAYEEQRQLAPLMRQHRLLALSAAPLAARMKVLRRLAKADPASPIWRDDIEAFEHARLSEIQADIARAKKKRDVDQLKALVEEVNGEWSAALPKGLRENTQQAFETLVRENARAEMVPIAAELNDCLSAFDVHRGRRLRTSWQALAKTAQLAETDPLVEQCREAMLWLAEADQMSADEKSFEVAVADLERAVEDRVPLADLERHLYTVQKFALEMPPAIARRTHQYHASLKLTHIRRSRLRLAVMALGIIVVATALLLYFSNRSRQQQLTDARAQLQALVDNPSYASAKNYYERLPSFLMNDPAVSQTWNKIEELNRTEVSSIAQFESLIEKINTDGALGTDIDQAVAQAEGFATTEDQKTIIKSLRSSIQIARTRRQSERNGKFSTALGKLAERLEELEKMDLNGLSALRGETDALHREHQLDVDGLPTVTASILGRATDLINRIDGRIRSANEYTESVKRLGDLTQSVGNVEGFAKRLIQFAEQHKSFPISPEIIAVAAESPLWESYAAWSALAEDTAWNIPLLIKEERAAQLLDQIKTLREKHPLGELPSAISKAEIFLQNVKSAYANDKDLPAKLDSVIKKYSRLEFREQKVLVDPHGNFKYFSAESKPKEDTGKTWFYFWHDLKKQKQDSELIDDRDLVKCQVGIAGQADLADALVKAVKLYNADTECDEFFRGLLDFALGDAQTKVPVDPVVQAVMLNEVLEIASQHSLFWREFTTASHKKLDELDVALIDWMEFNNPTTATLRRQVKTAIDELKSEYNAALTKVKIASDQSKNLGAWRNEINYQWVGWLYLLEGSWRIAGPAEIPDDTPIFILTVPRVGEPPAFQAIGTHSKGLLIDPKGDGSNKSGRPIFVRTKTE